MRFRMLFPVLGVIAAGLAFETGAAHAAPDAGIAPAELRRIELLVRAVEQSTDRSFIRNGTSYTAATAAEFLRLKWGNARDRVRTAEDFVREIGSQSGTTGSRYRIRKADGSEEDSAVFLGRLLAAQLRVSDR